MSYLKVKGIVLLSFDSKEKDRVSVVLTNNVGKIRVKFRSVKSSTSRRSGYTDDFTMTNILLYKKIDNFIATDLQIVDSFLDVKSILTNYFALSYIRELLILFLPYEQAEGNVFELVYDVLLALRFYSEPEQALLVFIFKFLIQIGIPISFIQDEYSRVYFSAERGGFNCKRGILVSEKIYKEMKEISESGFDKINKKEYFKEIMKLLNLFISYHSDSTKFIDFVENLQKINVG